MCGTDDELLLVDWLNALIYEMGEHRMCFGRFEVSIEDHRLRGRAWGEAVDVAKHELGVEVKGATYTDLRVAREPIGLWVAPCVVDVGSDAPASASRLCLSRHRQRHPGAAA